MMSVFRSSVAAAGIAMLASAAGAATIGLNGTGAFITCASSASQACQGLVGGSVVVTNPGNKVTGGTAASLSDTMASLYRIGNASEANEAQALDYLIDGVDDDDFTTGLKTTPTSGSLFSFVSSAEYVGFKVGNSTVFLKLLGTGPVSLTYDRNGAQGAGLSHVIEFGQLAVVPAPAAGLGLLGALAGLFALRRRKSA